MDKNLGTKGKILLCLIRCREEGGKGLRKKNDVGEREIFIYFLSQTVLPPFHFRLCFEKKNITDFHLCFEKKNITVQKKKEYVHLCHLRIPKQIITIAWIIDQNKPH